MTRETYQKMTGLVRGDVKKIRLLAMSSRIFTGIVFLAYPVFLFYLFWNRHVFLIRACVVPAVSFFAVTVMRKCINAPRPYEKYDMPPVLKKETKGNSFPSRHVFSAFMIAVTVGYCFPAAGVLLTLIGIIMSVIRVIGGVHEIKDVAAGAVIGIFCGVFGFYIF